MDSDDMDIIKFCIGGILGLAILCVGGIYVSTWVESSTYAGREYDVVITVQAVERSTRFWEHTNIWAQVYGEQDITYILSGFHNFEIGQTYNLNFKNKMVFHWYVGFKILGEVEAISVIDYDIVLN